MYLIDTDIIIWLLRKNEKYLQWFNGLKKTETLSISTVTVAEVYKNALASELIDIEDLLKDLEIFDVVYNIAKQAGFYWNQYVKKFKKIHILDCMIAATAKEYDLTILTLNTRHYPMTDIRVQEPLRL